LITKEKLCQHIFGSLAVKYEPILIKKMEGLSRRKPLTKLYQKCPLCLK